MAINKISKKLERLCRALAYRHLYQIRFPKNKACYRVDESWPTYLPEAKNLNLAMNLIEDWELDGVYDEDDVEGWSRGGVNNG